MHNCSDYHRNPLFCQTRVTSSRDFHHLTCYEARKKKFKKKEAWEKSFNHLKNKQKWKIN